MSVAHYREYERLINKVAYSAAPRVQALDPSMEFDEIKAFLNVTYTKCTRQYSEGHQVKFSTYLQTACYNALNRLVERLQRERCPGANLNEWHRLERELRVAKKASPRDHEAIRKLERELTNVRSGAVIGSMEYPGNDEHDDNPHHDLVCGAPRPDEVLEQKQHQREIMGSLSTRARLAVTMLSNPSPALKRFHAKLRSSPTPVAQFGPDVTMEVVSLFLRHTAPEARALRAELRRVTGVDFARLGSARLFPAKAA